MAALGWFHSRKHHRMPDSAVVWSGIFLGVVAIMLMWCIKFDRCPGGSSRKARGIFCQSTMAGEDEDACNEELFAGRSRQ